MASLTPQMGIQGSENVGDITDMLSEVKPATDEDKKKKISINTDEIEEKDVGIQMLAVFIDELGSAFLPYVEQTSKLFCGLAQYDTSDAIRQSIAGGFPGLVKCVKEANNGDMVVAAAREYLQTLWNAMEVETETETLICQIQSYKEILEIAEVVVFDQAQVDTVTNKLLESLNKSDQRIEENNKLYKEQEAEDEDEELDEEDLAMLKEENKLEHELQLSIAEVFGILFKHHKQFCAGITDSLLSNVLPKMIQIDEKNKKKFALFVMDDMVEFLGVDVLGADRYNQVVQQIILHCEHPLAAVRQAAAYGAGIIAQHSGAQFAGLSQQILGGIEKAIKFQMPPNTKGKQSKEAQFYHARDNAVSAVAKVIKYQNTTIDVTQYLPSFLDQLPITHDVEEGKFCNELLSEMLANDPTAVCGASGERLEQIVMILGKICQKKYADEATLKRLG
jgi:predicted RNA-binding protein Jag